MFNSDQQTCVTYQPCELPISLERRLSVLCSSPLCDTACKSGVWQEDFMFANKKDA